MSPFIAGPRGAFSSMRVYPVIDRDPRDVYTAEATVDHRIMLPRHGRGQSIKRARHVFHCARTGNKKSPTIRVRDFSSSFTYVFTYANDETLATQTQACDQRTVAFNVSVGQVLEQATTLTHQKQQTTA